MKLVETDTELQTGCSHLAITAAIFFPSPCWLILESNFFLMLKYFYHSQVKKCKTGFTQLFSVQLVLLGKAL